MDERIQREISHGKRIMGRAEEVWDWSGPAGRRRWSRRVRWLLERVPPGSRVLELGCGTGLFTRELAAHIPHLHSIDISLPLIGVAAARCREEGFNDTFSVQNAYDMGIRSGSMDVILAMSVLHHLDLEKALAEFHRVLRPRGILLFSEPNMLNPVVMVRKNVPFIKQRAGDTPDETAFFRWSIASRLRERGFSPRIVTPFDFLHPSTPGFLVSLVERFSLLLERTPLVREFAGSLFIEAVKE